MTDKSKFILTPEEIEEKVQKRVAIVRDILGFDFPMVDWYLTKYEDYFRKITTIESLTQAASKKVYLIIVSNQINIALTAPADADIDQETKGYAPLLEKDDVYGFVLYLVRERGFELMNAAFTFNMAAFLQNSINTRKTTAAALANAVGGVPFEDEDDKFNIMMSSLNEEQSNRFAEMMLKTNMMDNEELEGIADDNEKAMLKAQNEKVMISVEELKKAAAAKAKQGQPQPKQPQQARYTSDGYDTQKKSAVLLSGYPSNEMMHRYVGIGTLEEMQALSKDIQAALDEGLLEIPYCGTCPKNNRGKPMSWSAGPILHTFPSLSEARKFAAQFDHHYSESGYLLQ